MMTIEDPTTGVLAAVSFDNGIFPAFMMLK